MLSHAYNIIIDCSVGTPVNGRDVVYGLNTTDIRFIYMLITMVKLPGASGYKKQIEIHTSIVTGKGEQLRKDPQKPHVKTLEI